MHKNLKILITALLIVLFKKKIEVLLDSILVDPILKYVHASIINDSIFVLLNISLIAFVIKKVKINYRITSSVFVILLITSIFYSYYRFYERIWSFESFIICPEIAYFDFVYTAFLSVLTLYFLQKRHDYQRKNNNRILSKLVEDNPWTGTKTDLFNRTPAAKRIADFILESNTKKAFAIGVCADWGDGKSSFLQMIKNEIPDDNSNIVIEFNPWYSKDTNKIIKDFFDVFEEKLGQYQLNFSSLINHYSNSLSTIKESLLVSSVKDLTNIYKGSDSVESEHFAINEILKKLDKKIIIFIDDLDRLDKKEVIEVIKLIRNTANFFNVFFIVGFDREYVKNAISDINDHNVESYLEKIFQLEISPPIFDKVVLKQELAKLLIERFPSYEDAIKDSIYANPSPTDSLEALFKNEIFDFNIVEYYIKNLRDVIRFVNLFTINFSQVEGEVIFKEFFYVQLIQLKYPEVYQLIIKNEKEYFEIESFQGGPQYTLIKNENQVQN